MAIDPRAALIVGGGTQFVTTARATIYLIDNEVLAGRQITASATSARIRTDDLFRITINPTARIATLRTFVAGARDGFAGLHIQERWSTGMGHLRPGFGVIGRRTHARLGLGGMGRRTSIIPVTLVVLTVLIMLVVMLLLVVGLFAMLAMLAVRFVVFVSVMLHRLWPRFTAGLHAANWVFVM